MLEGIFRPSEILVPEGLDMEAWSVIACDQFTSEPEYWDRVKARTEGIPSTFHMIMPEAYLNEVPAVHMAQMTSEAMERYLNGEVFRTLPQSYIYVEREVTGGAIRRGIVGMLDLEAYDFLRGSETPVRASERTVAERLPARTLIREGAALELPHTLVLIDDPERNIIEPLTDEEKGEPLYDFDLMEGGGHIKGWQIAGERAERLEKAFDKLTERELAYVIGDGNHSLAAAKELWNKIRAGLTEEERETHPARFALCEVENVYDEGVVFEPIHRIIFNAEPEKLLELMRHKLESPEGRAVVPVVGGERREAIHVRGRSFGAMIDAMQDVLEEYESDYECLIDYIHDDESLISLTSEEGAVGFMMPVMDKSELFNTVLKHGVFPKKSFSIGHAKDKRYYLECRRIK